VDSTQDELLAALGEDGRAWPHLSALRAERQRRGRGRSGRVWQTEGVRALTVSYVLRPAAEVGQWGTLALRAGVAVTRALAEAGVEAWVKWPNDVVVAAGDLPGWHGIAKAGGVLGTVATDSTGAHVCVLGIGLNLEGDPGLPGAASLGGDLDAGELTAGIARHLGDLVSDTDPALPPLGELMAGTCHTLGKRVVVTFPHEDPPREISGVAARIDPDGALVVEAPGVCERILSGDVAYTRLQAPLG